MSEKLTKLQLIEKRLSQLNKRKDDILTAQKDDEDKLSTRQKIIIGAWVLTNDHPRAEAIKASLTRRQDRAAFGLEPLEPKKTPVNAETAVLNGDFMPH